MSQYEPAFESINVDPPTQLDRQIDENLFAYIAEEIKLESDEGMQHRNQILAEVKRIFQDWVKYLATDVLHLPEDEAMEVGGQLFVSGSHRLNVREPGADIDTVCVAPRFCLSEHFFSSLKERFLNHPEVKNLDAIPTAAVPIMSFEFQGVSIDLLFARLSDNSVPENIDIFDDKILRNLDDASVNSLNGPRVTYMISRLVPSFDNFLIVLRCIRRWAKRRGLYGNKMGYFGGVNLNILLAFVCQLYPNASPSSLLARFFKVYSNWTWPHPIKLNRIQTMPPHDAIWSPEMYPYHQMPIITPAYPAINSASSVSLHSRKAIQYEIKRGHEILRNIAKLPPQQWMDCWTKLFAPSDFFVRYNHYLRCTILADSNDDAARSWRGYVESRIRRLPDYLSYLPIAPVHLHPIQYASSTSEFSKCFYIGFDIDHSRLRPDDKNIYIDRSVADFRAELGRYSGELKDSLSFTADHFKWSQLPAEVFESLGGKAAAKALRRTVKPKSSSSAAVATPVPAAFTQSVTDSSVDVDVASIVPPTDEPTSEAPVVDIPSTPLPVAPTKDLSILKDVDRASSVDNVSSGDTPMVITEISTPVVSDGVRATSTEVGLATPATTLDGLAAVGGGKAPLVRKRKMSDVGETSNEAVVDPSKISAGVVSTGSVVVLKPESATWTAKRAHVVVCSVSWTLLDNK